MEWILGAVKGNDEVIPLTFGAVVGGILFGGLHCLAWNFQFPTSEEALAWKICSILTTSIPILSIVPFVFWNRLVPSLMLVADNDSEFQSSNRYARFLVGVILILLLVTYTLARLFLMVEIFRSLFFLPPEAFIDT